MTQRADYVQESGSSLTPARHSYMQISQVGNTIYDFPGAGASSLSHSVPFSF